MRILRVVGSRLLSCGCFVGIYETYDSSTVEIVDQRSRSCHDDAHREGRIVARYDADWPPQDDTGARTSAAHR